MAYLGGQVGSEKFSQSDNMPYALLWVHFHIDLSDLSGNYYYYYFMELHLFAGYSDGKMCAEIEYNCNIASQIIG